jgi:hypothetical protein
MVDVEAEQNPRRIVSLEGSWVEAGEEEAC